MLRLRYIRIISLNLCALTIITTLIGCAAPQLRVSRSQVPLTSPIRSVALMPSGGVLSDAIGIEMLNYGFEVIDTGKITSLIIRHNLSEIEITQPQNLRRLNDEGIDAILLVKSVAGYDNRPQSASVKIIMTQTGTIVAGVTWQNGRGGAQGSPADQGARVDLSVAAHQIAEALSQALGK